MQQGDPQTVHSPGRIAKDFQKLLAFTGRTEKLSWCQELAARHLGYRDWYDLRHNGSASLSYCGLLDAIGEFSLSPQLARYLMTVHERVSSSTPGNLVELLDAIVNANGTDHFTISLDPASPTHRLVGFGSGQREPIHRPDLIDCLRELWERSPGKPVGSDIRHQYYIGGNNRWKIDAFPGHIVLVGQRPKRGLVDR